MSRMCVTQEIIAQIKYGTNSDLVVCPSHDFCKATVLRPCPRRAQPCSAHLVPGKGVEHIADWCAQEEQNGCCQHTAEELCRTTEK